MRPWDLTNDKEQYESDFIVTTWTKHRTPVVRTLSITSLEQKPDIQSVGITSGRHSTRQIQRTGVNRLNVVGEESGSSTAEVDPKLESDNETRIRKFLTEEWMLLKSCTANYSQKAMTYILQDKSGY